MHDARAKQALYVAKKPPKSSMGFGAGRAILWLTMTALALGGAIWLFLSLV